jgi:hypothetical protein
MFDNRMPKQILEGRLGGGRPTGKPRSRWEDEVRKDVAKRLDTKSAAQRKDMRVQEEKHGRLWKGDGPKSHRRKKEKKKRHDVGER